MQTYHIDNNLKGGKKMVKIPSGKPAYIVCLLLIMLSSLGCFVSTSLMDAENYMPVINIGDGSAVVTFLIS